MRKPSLKRQVEVFHKIMHIANIACTSGDNDHFREIAYKMDDWSYAHRQGNGQLTDREQDQLIYKAFENLAATVENYQKK